MSMHSYKVPVTIFSTCSKFWLVQIVGLHALAQAQWHSQDEQVTWPQHGHIQCTRNMDLLGELGYTPTMKIMQVATWLKIVPWGVSTLPFSGLASALQRGESS